MITIENLNHMASEMFKVQPDIVIHAAALKHINTAEKQPLQAAKINIEGSMNVVEASKICNVPVTIGISTDKACKPDCIYGYTKLLMERIFSDADNLKNRYACCRFGNVAGSHGSVIPFWLSLQEKGERLKLTDPEMNRLMFLPEDAVKLIEKTIELASDIETPGGFVLSKKMKNVNMGKLASAISKTIEIVGSRPGEKLNEDLISEKEIEYSRLLDDGQHILLEKEINNNLKTRLTSELSTETAENMTISEITEMVSIVKKELLETMLFQKQY